MNSFKKFVFWVSTITFSSLLSLGIIFATLIFSVSIFISFIATIPEKFTPVKALVASNSCLILEFPEPLDENVNFNLSSIFSSNKQFSFIDLLNAVNNAASDPKITTIKLNLDAWSLSTRQSDELNSSLIKFKEAGKKVVAYATNLNNNNYLSASICHTIGMPDSNSAIISLSGYSTTIPYYKDLLDKIGVQMQVIHIGDYKSYGENFTRNNISDEFKSEMNKILSSIKNSRIDTIIKNRPNINPYFPSNLIKGKYMLIDVREAKLHNLIDALVSPEQFNIKFITSTNHISINNYCQFLGNSNFSKMLPSSFKLQLDNNFDSAKVDVQSFDECEDCDDPNLPCDACSKTKQLVTNNKNKFNLNSNRIALITLEGEITFDSFNNSAFSEDFSITPNKVAKMISQVKNSNYAGVVLRINSPGGSALASELILQQIIELQKTHKVYVSMADVAASGGYYIASSASKVFANAHTITGSIGVVTMIPNIKNMTQKIGINPVTLSYGTHSDIFSITNSLTPNARELLNKSMTATYNEFLDHVVKGRNIDKTTLHLKLAQGRIWTGSQAKKNKLVDEIGTLYDAAENLAKDLNIEDYTLEEIKSQPNVFDRIFSMSSISAIIKSNSPEVLQPAYKIYNKIKAYDSQPLLLLTHDIKF